MSRDLAREDAEHLSSRLLLLPVHAQLEPSHIERCATILRGYLNGIRPEQARRDATAEIFGSQVTITSEGTHR
jgi:hypothetical protein